MTETGLPGSPKKSAPPTLPNASGRPGFIAIFQKPTSPVLSSVSFTKSASPTETPPEVMIASAAAAASRNARSTSSRASRTTPRSRISAPTARSMAKSV